MTDTKTSPAKRNCDGQPSLAPATGSAATSDAEQELTPMEDALLMLDLWETTIRKHITVQPRSPIHRLVKETVERLKQPNEKGQA